MERHFIRLFAFLTIACWLALQPAEATNNNVSETIIKPNNDNRVGLGFTTTFYSTNRGLVESVGFSWKIWTSRNFDLQGLFFTNRGTDVWAANRFLYISQIKSLGKLYFGWGMNYPILQAGMDSKVKTSDGPWFETLLGFEYFFSDRTDFGYAIEVGVNPLELRRENSEDKLGVRLQLTYHNYF